MPFGEDVGLDDDFLADGPLDREEAAVDRRMDRLDDHPRRGLQAPAPSPLEPATDSTDAMTSPSDARPALRDGDRPDPVPETTGADLWSNCDAAGPGSDPRHDDNLTTNGGPRFRPEFVIRDLRERVGHRLQRRPLRLHAEDQVTPPRPPAGRGEQVAVEQGKPRPRLDQAGRRSQGAAVPPTVVPRA